MYYWIWSILFIGLVSALDKFFRANENKISKRNENRTVEKKITMNSTFNQMKLNMKITVLLDIENQHNMNTIRWITFMFYSRGIQFDLHVFHSHKFVIPRKSQQILEFCNCTVHVAKTSLADAADIILIKYLISIQKSKGRIVVLSNDKVIHTAVAEFNDDYKVDVFNIDGFYDVLDDLLQECSIPNYPMLMVAARRNNLPKVKDLLYNGHDVNSHIGIMGTFDDENSWDYNDSLLIACENNYVDMVKFLIINGANVNIRNYSGWTPLIIAVCRNYVRMVKVLLDAGAKIDNHVISVHKNYRNISMLDTGESILNTPIKRTHYNKIGSLLLRHWQTQMEHTTSGVRA